MTTASFRIRYLLGLLAHVALALVACKAPGPKAASILARCGAGPSFAAATELKRWASFPVDVHVELASIPASLRDAYREGIERGLGLWSEATGGRIGRFRVRFDRPDAPVRIVVTERPLPAGAVGSTELTFAASRIVSATVAIARSPHEVTGLLTEDIATTTAHEAGHVLGIIDHSPYPGDAMWVSGNFPRDGAAPGGPTARDVHTLEEAYCREFDQLATGRTVVSSALRK